MGNQWKDVLALVRLYPGFTSSQFAATSEAHIAGLNRATIARRLPEIEEKGFVRRGIEIGVSEYRWFPSATSKNEEEKINT
jgi:hypothetical protein